MKNKYILISGGAYDVKEVEGFFNSVEDALNDAKERGLVDIEIYELSENTRNLAEDK